MSYPLARMGPVMRRMVGFDGKRSRKRPPEDLREKVSHCYHMATRWTAKLMELAVEVEESALYLNDGCDDTASWLSNHLGMGYMRAQELTEVALALRRLRSLKRAYLEGRISFDHLRALVQVASEETEEDLLTEVGGASVAHAFRVVKKIQGVSKEDSRAAREQRWVETRKDHDNRLLYLFGVFPEEEGVRVERAIDRLAGNMPEDPSFDGKTPIGVKRADALAALAASVLTKGSPSTEVVVHVRLDDLLSGKGAAEIDGGPLVSPETARRLLCDGYLQTVIDDPRDPYGEPLWVGERRPRIPRAIRRQVLRTQKRCAFPGCRRNKLLEIHHQDPKGSNDPGNLKLFCAFHHWFAHEFECETVGTPPSLRLERPHGPSIDVGPPAVEEATEQEFRREYQMVMGGFP